MVPPGTNEYAPAFARYISLAADIAEPLNELAVQQARVLARLSPLSEDRAGHRYASDKWSIKEVVNHLSDVERVFAYRMLRFGRGDKTPLPGFDENDYAQAAQADRRTFRDLVHEWIAVREATVTLVRSLPDAAWANEGTMSGSTLSARALLYVILGHTEHHLVVLADRYGVR
jgi:uncharacterized damage-inducible protein DinB